MRLVEYLEKLGTLFLENPQKKDIVKKHKSEKNKSLERIIRARRRSFLTARS